VVDLAPAQVDAETWELEPLLDLLSGDRVGTSQVGPDPSHQFAHLEGLDHIVVRAQLQPHHHIDGVALGGQHDDRDFVAVGSQLPAHVQSAHPRQVDVQQYQVR
jgi:hypothetical protein